MKTVEKTINYGKSDSIESRPSFRPSLEDELGRFGDRVTSVVGLESVRTFARIASIDEKSLRSYMAGKTEPSRKALLGISYAGNVNIEWLATGEGEMRRSSLTTNQEQIDKTTQKVECLEQLLPDSGRFFRNLTPDDVPDGFVLVPRYDVAASMGNGAVIHSEQVVDHLAFRAEWVRTELGTSPRNLILISAIGDSMEPSLRAGDLLLIDRSVESVRQDSIYAIAHDGELRIKRIQRLFDGSLVIKSDNPNYRTEELSPAQAEQMRIVGRVVWSGRRM